jgi:hypothetical protein
MAAANRVSVALAENVVPLGSTVTVKGEALPVIGVCILETIQLESLRFCLQSNPL